MADEKFTDFPSVASPTGGEIVGISAGDNARFPATAFGNVAGPASSTDKVLARFNGTNGKTIQSSGVTVADSAAGTITGAGIVLSGSNTGDNAANSSSIPLAQRGATNGVALLDASRRIEVPNGDNSIISRISGGGISGVTKTFTLPDKNMTFAGTDDVAAVIAQTITNGVTTSAPSQDAVFDALAPKAPLASPVFSGSPKGLFTGSPSQAAAQIVVVAALPGTPDANTLYFVTGP